MFTEQGIGTRMVKKSISLVTKRRAWLITLMNNPILVPSERNQILLPLNSQTGVKAENAS
jgi:hypothetical protein